MNEPETRGAAKHGRPRRLLPLLCGAAFAAALVPRPGHAQAAQTGGGTQAPAAGGVWSARSASQPAGDSGWTAPAWLFPRRNLFPDLLAAPREPVSKGALVYADPNPSRYGPGVAGEVAVSATLPVARLAGSTDANALVIGMEAAAFARFCFQVVERELVNTDWVFTVPLVWHLGPHWLRLRYYHTSSHIGDEYGRRFDERGVNFSRDAVDFTAYFRPLPVLGAYGGLFYSVITNPEARNLWRAHAGLELEPGHRRTWTPYAAADLELDESVEWQPRLSAQAGIWLPAVDGRPLRLALEGIAGPSPLGQFNGVDTRQVGLALYWNP